VNRAFCSYAFSLLILENRGTGTECIAFFFLFVLWVCGVWLVSELVRSVKAIGILVAFIPYFLGFFLSKFSFA
jgi:hypothetical protein